MCKALAAVLLLAATNVRGDVSFFQNPATAIPALKEAPTIDGGLTDAAWASVRRLTRFRDYKTGKEAEIQTTVLAGFDRENLYLAFECREPDIAKLTRREIAHDSMALFSADHIEVFVKTAPAADMYYQFAVGVFGARYESKVQDASWSPKWRAASSVGKGLWSVEIAIPFRVIGEKVPSFLLANFCRDRRIAPGEISCWSPTFGRFHNPARFGSVVLGEEHPVSVTNAVVSEVSRGKYRVSAVVKSSAKARKELSASVYTKPGKEFSLAARKQVVMVPDSSLRVDIPIEFRDAYNGPLVMVFRDAATDDVLWFADPQVFSLGGSNGLKVVRALGEGASPALRWLETERLRACCDNAPYVNPLPELRLRPVSPKAGQDQHCELAVKGQVILRIYAARGEKVRFQIKAGKASSPFAESTYAVFTPDGTFISDGTVEQGKSTEVAIPAQHSGLHVVWLNSGPASDNCCALKLHNRSWVIDGRGKEAYRTTRVSLNYMRDISLAGFNTAFLSFYWSPDYSTEKGLNAFVDWIRIWAEAAARYGVRLIPYVGWGCTKPEVQAAGEYRKTLSTREIDGPRPCPLSKEYWERTFLRRALAVARLSKQCPAIVGFGIDPESYHFSAWYRREYEKRKMKKPGWESVVFFSNDECFCDHCFFGFLASRGLKRPPVAADGKARFEWLKEQGLAEKYFRYLDAELCALTARVRQKVHAVNPDLVFAVMLLGHTGRDYHWWCSGVSRGLGTPRLPVFDFDERTYTIGFTPMVDRHKKRYVQWRAHVLHGGALWLGKHLPRDPHFLSAQMYHFAVRDAGYWFWPTYRTLFAKPDKLHTYLALAGFQEDYWRAFVRANREIDRKLRQGDSYVSKLDVLKQPPPAPDLDKAGKNVWSRKPFYSLRVKSGTKLSFYVPKATKRFTFIWGLREGAGEWKVVLTSPQRPVAARRFVSAEKGEEIGTDVQPGEQGKAWTVQVEKVGEGGGDYLGIGLRGLAPFFSSRASALLVSETP